MAIEPGAWERFLQEARARARAELPLQSSGTLTRLTGLVLEASGIRAPVGAQCTVQMPGQDAVLAEVVGFAGDRALLMPAGDIQGLSSGASVVPAAPYVPVPRLGEPPRAPLRGGVLRLPMGAGLLGRVVDAQGQPLDHGGPLAQVAAVPLGRGQINAMERDPVRTPLDTGVRAINALLTVGRGQRLGLFAGSGVGKSVLLGMMARYTAADVIVVGLIGERGREVKEFIEDILGEDRPRALGGRRRAGRRAAAVAHAGRGLRHGHRRAFPRPRPARAAAHGFADALRDGAARDRAGHRRAAGHQGLPAVAASPSCRSWSSAVATACTACGSITAFYTVLSEGDDQQDPIADAARAILDGHIVLARALAEAGHYPAIDIEQSASRVMHSVVTRAHLDLARRFRALYSRYQKSRDLIQVGAYVPGTDPQLDEAIRLQPQLAAFLQQDMYEAATLEQSVQAMAQLLGA